jgi:hypothetical protein
MTAPHASLELAVIGNCLVAGLLAAAGLGPDIVRAAHWRGAARLLGGSSRSI